MLAAVLLCTAPVRAGDRATWVEWRKSLETALLAGQMEHGGWDTVDAWSGAGGETYATATCVLALLAPAQFSEDFFQDNRGKRFDVHEEVHEALEGARRSKNRRIAFAANAATRSLRAAAR